MARDSFILYTEQKEVIDKLSDEQAGKLIKAIYEYVQTDKMPELDLLLDLVITPIKVAIDRNNNKWQEIKQKRSEAGKISAEVKKQNSTNSTNVKCVEQKQQKVTNSTVNVSVNDNVNVNVSDSVNVNDNNIGDSCVDGLDEIVDFYNNNIGAITPYSAEVLQSYAEEMQSDLVILAMKKSVEADKRTIQYIKAILNNWSKKGIKTVLEAEKENKAFKNKTKDNSNMTQRNYTEEEFEKLLK